MATRGCAHCGAMFDAKHPSAKFCGGTCRKAANRAGTGTVVEIPARKGDPALVASVRAQLRGVGRHESPLGVAALELASTISDPLTVANAKAGLVKELRATLAEALKGAGAASAVDELRARRARRVTG